MRMPWACWLLLFVFSITPLRGAEPLRLATFQVDATPPLGSPLCEGAVPPAKEIVDRLSARGLILVGSGPPVCLVAVDWVGIANASHDRWRETLAGAIGTSADRVAVHALHQHDAPGIDESSEALLAARGMRGQIYNAESAEQVLRTAADAARAAMQQLTPATHLGVGIGVVEGVASNRRILGADGRVQHVRFSSCKDEAVRAAPEGTIDPRVRLISLWSQDRPLVVLSYYATHPQSYYGQGGVSADFVGMARALREAAVPGVPHIHFNGAGGNVAAGKYNDGSPAMRPILAERLAVGMQRAWEATERRPIDGAALAWNTTVAKMPLRDIVQDESALARVLDDAAAPQAERMRAARDLAYCLRVREGKHPVIACLGLGPDIRVLHMPGELFVEYQLAAQQMAPQATVCMAAYGDYGAGYIGTAIAYSQGGYETSPVSRTAPEVEESLMTAMRQLLKADATAKPN
ncbi:MAG: hypothetical protein K1X71_01645 [Pirellulales bacterium]|nr:hypothetical protein [Pirellulales bacterium]